ncbi:MAG: hypothetical protein A2845_01775 [Candidatus Lloydbacteria bacterium RIFCSPHIGHO2_01_FULL_49_22]|uniref:DUF3298 domain-containing protein n=1 Tax=Candidatus Lloydbacteria bacterium RIFCSPHIGHO2_01_FULL_49_22 TaxID=1798658 RepID=A0A1G2CXM4_9BACT|nr:MAG: hypothetical protein A2845_01775 [Candidatus Lloydbacteria bacterium RIFCSPHIGHO2_01_FULL_49_22]OGZ10026.1 MAG: hypothetical protein A3C14_04940 [Candidatus Lloydbacteria bacterium RIFCSPHIGHO2_02_FULL_50_18]
MKSIVRPFAFFILIILLLLGAYLMVPDKKFIALRGENDAGVAIPPSEKFIEVPLASDTEQKESNSKERYAYNVHFPKIALMDHPELANEVNAVLFTFADQVIRDFRTHIVEMYSPEVPSSFSSDLTMRWSPQLLSPTIISIRFDRSEYIAGSAHPNSQSTIINYDIEERTKLATSDLFASSTEAFPFLSSFTRDELTRRFVDVPTSEYADMLLPGTAPTNENFANVAIVSDGLIVIFNPYQVAPYARGSQEVHIPLSSLGDRLKPRMEEAMRLANMNFIEATPEPEEAQ